MQELTTIYTQHESSMLASPFFIIDNACHVYTAGYKTVSAYKETYKKLFSLCYNNNRYAKKGWENKYDFNKNIFIDQIID